MVTVDEEVQAKEFLKRAEIRTMKKDLMALRETDALKERDKIIKLRTLEEQITEKQKKDALANAKIVAEKIIRNEILTKNEGEERVAEKDLKNYVTEQEHQQIFLLESQRLGFEKDVDIIDKEKDPELKLEKNKLLLLKRDQQATLNSILEKEKKLENEQKFIIEKEGATTIDSQRKSLEQSRWDLDEKIKEIEKKRWAAEKGTQDTDIEIAKIDKSSEILVTKKNTLKDKILGIDKSLREIYSIVINREEEKRKGLATEQIAKREALAKIRASENENIQRQQWTGVSTYSPKKPLEIPVPFPARKNLAESFKAEEEARKKFMADVEQGAKDAGQMHDTSNINK